MEYREREIECKRLKPYFVTLQNAAGAAGFIGKGVEEKGGENQIQISPQNRPKRELKRQVIVGDLKQQKVLNQT